jgi:prepilin-type N-terminal cleavage/methylation domain-containing protein
MIVIPRRRPSGRDRAFTLVELLVVIFVMSLLIAILLPALNRARKSALSAKMRSDMESTSVPAAQEVAGGAVAAPTTQPRYPAARIRSLQADISLVPRLSVGTAEPQSIYEAKFTAAVQASRPDGAPAGDCELELPLPPQVISLADLSVTAAGEPSEAVSLRDGKLVWRGPLTTDPTPLAITYTAVGRGLYQLDTPPGGIVDTFQIQLAAHESDVRMLQLSLQPTKLSRSHNVTNYTWDYKRLLLGRPIQLDVLGIAPIDRLGEVSWLGPISLVVFGLVLGLVAYAYRITQFDRWTLLLVLGTFAGSYPLMYFAQEFIPLKAALVGSSTVVLAIIAVRSITAMGARLALLGVVLPAAIILAITLAAALRPNLQGLLLTIEALAFFVFAMALMPRLNLRGHLSPLPPTGPTVATA